MNSARRCDPPQVAVCVDQFRSHGRGVMRGIAKYVESHGPWSLVIDWRAHTPFPNGRSENWQGDGILTYIEDRARAERLRKSGIPTVELFAYRDDHLLPLVAHDDFVVGQFAAEHLAARSFRHFAFCGYSGALWSERRREGFSAALTSAELEAPHCLAIPRPKTFAEWEGVLQEVSAWIKHLPGPLGLLACTDHHAQTILEACRRAAVNVPEEVAVLGVDNDEEICRLSNPSLTSVILNSEQVGYEGARLLHVLMRGKHQSGRDRRMGTAHHEADCGGRNAPPLLIPPLGVAARRSSDVLAIGDPMVARAEQIIREKAIEGVAVEDLLRQFNISRTVFYQRFHEALGRAPHQEILRAQLEHAKSLLRQSRLPLKKIAEMSGFSNPNYLSVAFKREVGVTPREYRGHQNGN